MTDGGGLPNDGVVMHRSQPVAARFWASLGEGVFRLPRCARCAAWQAPDASVCERCGTAALRWGIAPPVGAVFSLMIPLRPEGAVRTIAVVDLDAGPRMMAVCIGSPRVGMRVAVLLPSERTAEGLPIVTESAN